MEFRTGHGTNVRGLFIRLSNSNEHSNTNDPDKKKERVMKECVCVEACEGMLEDMPVTLS